MKEDMEQLIDPNEVGQGKKSKTILIVIILTWIILLFFAFQVIVGYLNLHRIYDGKTPYFLIREEETNYPNQVMKVYHFGLYKIIVIQTDTNTSTTLRVFFFDEKEMLK